MGITGNDAKKIKWMFLSQRAAQAPAPVQGGGFCGSCGAPLAAGARFCNSCGAKTPAAGTAAPTATAPTATVPISGGYAAPTAAVTPPSPQTCGAGYAGSIGFSAAINDPVVKEHIKKSNKTTVGCMIFGAPIPFIVMLIASLVGDEISVTDALIFGGGLSVIILIVLIILRLSQRAKNSWDGVITDKQHRCAKRYVKRTDDNEHKRWIAIEFEQYDLTVRTNGGKTEHILEKLEEPNDRLHYYPYFNVGDRLRYYPQLSYEYEKYDNSHDTEIPCLNCKHFNDIRLDKCEECGCPLFK